MILTETFNFLKTKHTTLIKSLTITDARLGIHLTAVQLSDNSCGVASTNSSGNFRGGKTERDFSEFSPLKIKGRTISELFEMEKTSARIDALRIAVLNAISSTLFRDGNYIILEDTDPIDIIDLNSKKTITIVGAFQSYMRKISGTENTLHVLEFNEHLFSEEHKQYYRPAEEYKSILPISDIVIITGLSLVNNTIDGLLSAVSPQSQVIVTGPSSSIIPDVLFQNHVNIIGATRITNTELALELASQEGSGYHLFKYCAQKICILNTEKI